MLKNICKKLGILQFLTNFVVQKLTIQKTDKSLTYDKRIFRGSFEWK